MNIIAIEEQFQQLRYLLNLSTSKRLKLNYLNQYLYLLSSQNNPINYQSYLMELLPFFTEYISWETLRYRSIEFIQALQKNHTLFSQAQVHDSKSPDFNQIKKRLSDHLAKTYFYLGAWKEGLQIVFPNIQDNITRNFISLLGQSEHIGSGLNTFQEILKGLAKVNDRQGLPEVGLKTLHRLGAEWQKIITEPKADRVWVMLIEQNSANLHSIPGTEKCPFDDTWVATILPLGVKADIRPLDADQDHILLNNRPLSLNDLIFHQAQDAVAAARKVLSDHGQSNRRQRRRYNIVYSFPDKHSFYTGDSQGLAMGLLNAVAMSALSIGQYTYKLNQDFAVTGVLELGGNVRPIAEQSLKPKLEALFYSPFNKALVPRENREPAEFFLEKLSSKYANRNLKIEAVETLSDCFNNPALVIKEKTPLADRFLNKNLWKKYCFAALILILSLLGLNAIDWDRNPVALKIDGNFMRVYNLAGKELWNYDFGFELEPKYYNTTIGEEAPRYVIDDLDADGKNEVLLGTTYGAEKVRSGVIYYFNSKGKLKWKFQDHPVMTFGQEVMDNFYITSGIYAHDFNGDGPKEIIVKFHHYLWYPARIVRLNLQGEVEGSYWNSGHIADIKFIDLDGDGIEEIVFSATNNDYNRGVLGVLEYDNISGHSPPDQFAYTPQGVKSGTEKYYLRFPTMDHLLPPTKGKRDATERCTDLGQNRLAVYITQAGFNNATVHYTMDYDFNILKMDFADGTFVFYNKKYGSELYDDFGKEELQTHFKTIEFWDGDKWVTEPTKIKTVTDLIEIP